MLLVANRGEIALRIIRTATELGLDTVAVYAEDDSASPHVGAATRAVPLAGSGPAAYLDQDAILRIARDTDCTLVHPGYGFLSENAAFADRCADAGVTFVGPDPDALRTFGDKQTARATAAGLGIPVVPASGSGDPEDLRAFLAQHPDGIVVKALAGGGGRGMRIVRDAGDLVDAHRSAAAEALGAFGDDRLYAEALITRARHIEVQIVAAPDGVGGTVARALGDRDCSVQRRHQKLVEIAPAPALSEALRRDLHVAAARLGTGTHLRGVATVEFLVAGSGMVFLEVNPRIQVEHTVTEEVAGIDLVTVQIAVARGALFDELELPEGITADSHGVTGAATRARGVAVQARVNTETLRQDGQTVPATGTLSAFTPPSGPGIRVDTHGRLGLEVGARYDSLLAKVIAHVRVGASEATGDFTRGVGAAFRKLEVALGEFVVDGVATNRNVLRKILTDTEFRSGPVTTSWLGERLTEFVDLHAEVPVAAEAPELGAGEHAVRAEMVGTVVESAAEGGAVPAGAPIVILDAMKMQHAITAPGAATVTRMLVQPGQTVQPGTMLAVVHLDDEAGSNTAADAFDLDFERADLDEIRARHAATLDAARPGAVARRHNRGRRTARENITDLVDADSFVEYGGLVLAAQRARRSEEDLIANTPADGLVGGTARIDGADVVVMSYDYTVLAGTQGRYNHSKTDRLLELAARREVPVVLFAEGGGGRPGDVDVAHGAGLELSTFRSMAALHGRVPTVAVVSGRCFAGNAALAGVCDVLIATPDANIGMGGPAMIEGGGLGEHRPEEIGPIDVQRRNGVVHLAARDEEHAVALTRQYLSYFTVRTTGFEAPDPRLARHVVPEDRLRAYDVRAALTAVADVDSVLELRADYGVGIVTALVRVEGTAYGVLANSSHHLGGAIDAEAADKAADFLELCEEHRIPVVSLCDTPGFMVGPESEKQATVRRFGRFFIAGARLTVPFGTIILRKGYGLGAMAMAGGSFHSPQFTIAWPTGEIGGMGLEGAVRLGFRKELDAAPTAEAREELFGQLVAAAYQRGKALQAATIFELDDVIDPAETRTWISGLR
ncbi:acetyl-CoA carboxylase family protein [Rhodococcus artemisiae]|uniref:acetyl-CoA carboxylase n=1 Tax=Rhodococcus artemisiae TaxID=714159 RepID=A0ABU7L978_9NOCA|nr:carboxyl transferase domain-containing protein [Rhodococcus artemisiae]MEE2058101.1 carboxyl transferase domain-containing protein [Rhodococcus artemisiae]